MLHSQTSLFVRKKLPVNMSVLKSLSRPWKFSVRCLWAVVCYMQLLWRVIRGTLFCTYFFSLTFWLGVACYTMILSAVIGLNSLLFSAMSLGCCLLHKTFSQKFLILFTVLSIKAYVFWLSHSLRGQWQNLENKVCPTKSIVSVIHITLRDT